MGFGLGAASCVGDRRWKNTTEMTEYMGSSEPSDLRREEYELDVDDARSEAMFLGLRLTEGINEMGYTERYGAYPEELYGEWIRKMIKEGLLERKDAYLKLTQCGQDLSNYVMAGFV